MSKPIVLSINVPSKIGELARQDTALSGALNLAVSDFSTWLSDNKTPFFFDYTDHGIAHVSNVLRSVESLIAEHAWSVMTPSDAVAAVAAVLLHDCAMHLSADGFFSLLHETPREGTSTLFQGESSWLDEFSKFEQEASRWDASKLMSVFGDSEPAELVGDSVSLNDRQKYLVGEFLRRHHARLAHEIALDGIPGRSGQSRFSPFSRFELSKRDLFGFLARSHNLSIRAAADKLPRMRRRLYDEVHVPFVMALLRIADYIQIDAARAPTQILQVRGLKSPLSRSEWAKHHAVLELHQQGEDPEALNVITDPKSVDVYCGLKSLLVDLQRELDESWALLGEVYGRFSDLKSLGLSVRRIQSNIDDTLEFERTNRPSFIPREIRLTTASAELLHLLVSPLYGNDPNIGVRELIQNAIDATLERAACNESADTTIGSDYVPLVEVELDIDRDGARALRVTDNGVGMTLDTLEGYFLKAGASFRKSQWWQAAFLDDLGQSKVRRSGRFGVGALAAFLVGPRIALTTRHFLDQTGQGLKLEMSLDNGLIEISRVDAPIGTSISVRIASNEVVDALLKPKGDAGFSDWYIYDSPTVSYRVHKEGAWSENSPALTISSPVLRPDGDWVPVLSSDFDGIYWNYERARTIERSGRRFSRFVCCNGIFVFEIGYREPVEDLEISIHAGPISVNHPSLMVDDKNGRFPLNVQRDGLAESRYPFHDELQASIADVMAREMYLALAIEPIPANIPRAVDAFRDCYEKYSTRSRARQFGLMEGGWIPLEPGVLAANIPDILLVEASASEECLVLPQMDFAVGAGQLFVTYSLDGHGFGTAIAFIRSLMDGSSWGYESPVGVFQKHISGLRLYVRNDIRKAMEKKGAFPQFLWRQLNEVFTSEAWSIFESGVLGASLTDYDKELIVLARGSDSKIFVACYIDKDGVALDDVDLSSPFAKAWLEMCPGALRPLS